MPGNLETVWLFMFKTKILLIFVFNSDNVLRTVLALFMEGEALPLPTLEEVLICNQTTTAEEVEHGGTTLSMCDST